ncbi:MAG: hypothetical protein U1C33_01235, partial [Candidatus Cloacimonadaceae bacterium]|nr:hypothetical protein [Candidatus Cloacimonadaceae bacterium]
MQQSCYPGFTALLGGSFDPFHNGHLHIARMILKHSGISSLAFVPCGHHNFKKDTIKLEYHL